MEHDITIRHNEINECFELTIDSCYMGGFPTFRDASDEVEAFLMEEIDKENK